jgi:hypothetical protein
LWPCSRRSGAGGGWWPAFVCAPGRAGAHGGGLFPGPARFIAFGAAAGELIADKQPDMGSRWAPRGLSLRLGFSTMAGHELAGAAGAVVAAAAAPITARGRSLLRGQLSDRPASLLAAALEDAISYGLVGLATRKRPRLRMLRNEGPRFGFRASPLRNR